MWYGYTIMLKWRLGLPPESFLASPVGGFIITFASYFGLVSLVAYALIYSIVTKLLIRVQRYKYEVCIHCGYPLVGLDDVGKCPECSEHYDIDTTRQIWERMCKQSLQLRIRRKCKALFGFGSSG